MLGCRFTRLFILGEIERMQVSRVQELLRPLLFLLVLGLILPLFTSCENRKTIVNGLEEKEANEIIVFLSNRNIDAAKVQAKEVQGGGGSKVVLWDISVNADQSIEAMTYLNQSGLPRRRSQSLLGIFGTVGLVPSDMEQKIRYQAGLAEQIASTIRKIDGILDAEVQISFPEEDPLNPGKNKGKITASVYVKHSGVMDDPNLHLATKIKRLVAASVTGLDIDNVTVIAERGRYSDMPYGADVTAEEDKQFVSVWTLVIAKESLTRFRIIFFSFILVILILVMTLLWMGWKVHPLLEQSGGIRDLFNIKPIKAPLKSKDAALNEAKPATDAKEPPKDDKDNPDKGVDIT